MKRHGHTGLWGLPTGIKTLDELTGGWRNDDLVLLAGRTNEGKSMVGGFFAYHAWRALQTANINSPVIYITTEMPELEVSFRLDTLKAHFSNRALNEGHLPEHELYQEYLQELKKKDTSFLILSEEANGGRPFTPLDIRALIESEKPAFMVIDQLYDLSDGTSESDIRKRIVRVTNGIRETNLYTQTPMMLIAQAGRNAAKEAKKDPNATPELFDIQESDNPAQKATRVLTLRLLNDTFKMSLKKNRGGKKDQDIFMKADLDSGYWEENFPETLVF
jgi:replicative DNA helicase